MTIFKNMDKNRVILKRIFLLYLVTFLIILPLLCWKMQFSIYNLYNMDSKEGRDDLITRNKIRIMTARQYERVLKGIYSIQHTRTGIRHVDLAITVITTVRNQHNLENYQPLYLTQVVWKFLWLLKEAERSGFKPRVLLSVCNVDARPESHQEATDFTPIIPVIVKYSSESTKYLNLNIFEKEKQDYVFCLNSSLLHNPKYVLLVEDDAYPNDDLFIVLERIFCDRLNLMSDLSFNPHRHKTSNVTYIKLYHPERLQSYLSLEPDRLTELFGMSALFGTLLTVLYRSITKLTSYQVNVIWVGCVVYVALIGIAIGRPHLLEMRRLFSPYLYSFSRSPECCTPAMLYPREGALQVINYLNSHSCYIRNAKDTVLDRFIREEHRHAYIVQPNLFKHVGLFSSLRGKFLNPYVVK